MKTKHLLFFLLMIYTGTLFAQKEMSKEASIKWSGELEGGRSSFINKIVGHDEDYYYVLFEETTGLKNKKNYYLEKFDMEMKQIASEEIVLDESSKKREFESVIYFNNELFLLSSYNDKKADFKYLYIQKIDKNTLTPEKNLLKIADIDYNEYRQSDFGSFLVDFSADSSKLFLHYVLPSKKKMKQKFGMKVFDNELNILWENKVVLPYLDELFETQEYRVDNEGNTYILGKLYKDKVRDKRKGKPNYKYQLICFKNNGSEYTEYPIELPNKYITDLQVEINSNLDIICAGLYSKFDVSHVDGSCYLNIDGQTGDVRSKSVKEFDNEFIVKGMTERKKRRVLKNISKGDDYELYSYKLDKLVLREDGGVLLVGEQYWIEQHVYYNSQTGQTSVSYEYHYNDICIVNVNSEGQIDWATKIIKKQETRKDPLYFSYSFAQVGKDLYFLYNDHEDNIEKDDDDVKVLKNVKNSYTMIAHLDPEGNITTSPLFKNERKNAFLMPLICQQVSPNEVIAYVKRGKMEKFAKITYNN